MLIAAIYINFAPFFEAVQAEHIWACDTEFGLGIEEDQCLGYERPLRHLPESMFQKPADLFKPWYEIGEDMIDLFGHPNGMPDDFFAAWQRWTLWIGIYTTGMIFTLLVVIGAYVLAATAHPGDTRPPLEVDE
ncbi:MAG: hypothetical protein ACTSXZ_09445 [Alphaproteobacteria bacterium]